MIHVSVITLNYKEPQLTKKCVQSLLRQKEVIFEIIIIDNSATEEDKKILSSLKENRVKVFHMEKNIGCAEGYNYGIEKAKGTYVFIVNNDTKIMDKSALSKMKTYLDTNRDVAVLQPKIKSLQKPQYFEYAGAAGGFLDRFGYPFCRGRIFQVVEKDKGQYNTVTPITWASTCAFFARKNVLQRLGLFDQIYFAYAEEVDISLRIWRLGYKVIFFPFTEVYHKGETSWKKIRGRKTFLIHRNHLILYFKCTPFPQVLFSLPQRLLLEIISLAYYSFHKSNLHVFPVLLSYVAVFFLFPKIIQKRKDFFKNSKKNNAITYKRSIALDHFIMKKKYFSQLRKEHFLVYDK